MGALVEHAKVWGAMKHVGQTRKYTGEPYFTHCEAVYEFVREAGLSETARVAALLHDTVEDTDVTIEEIEEIFGTEVAGYIWYLTKPPFYVGNRYKRKELDRNRLSLAPEEVRSIKFFDLYHNAFSIKEHDQSLYIIWRNEAKLLLEAMKAKELPCLKEEHLDFIDTI